MDTEASKLAEEAAQDCSNGWNLLGKDVGTTFIYFNQCHSMDSFFLLVGSISKKCTLKKACSDHFGTRPCDFFLGDLMVFLGPEIPRWLQKPL